MGDLDRELKKLQKESIKETKKLMKKHADKVVSKYKSRVEKEGGIIYVKETRDSYIISCKDCSDELQNEVSKTFLRQ